jgi:hypothetical protein
VPGLLGSNNGSSRSAPASLREASTAAAALRPTSAPPSREAFDATASAVFFNAPSNTSA